MDYSNGQSGTCPVGFDVMRPKKSEDDRIEVEVGFFYKGKEKGAERSFGEYDDFATIFLDREVIENGLPEAANLDRLLVGNHLRVEELDEMNPFKHIGSIVTPTAKKRDYCKLKVEDEMRQAFTASTQHGKREKCQDAVRHLLKDEKASVIFREFVKYDTLQRLVK